MVISSFSQPKNNGKLLTEMLSKMLPEILLVLVSKFPSFLYFHRSAASMSSENLLEIHILWSQPRPRVQKLSGVGPHTLAYPAPDDSVEYSLMRTAI